ncbi:NADH dehydrogenase [ubiquinone] 1 alpha subcomplex subunit 5-like [Clavelina lepadiformis]|uniref:NADH dehydrogenase [ubiquinone] 1 alpha subcomplex subunit 5 n=1 Tax=Clavelina lepadiformis TaxID=159417 RepID=A0ABP0FSA9_CLALP
MASKMTTGLVGLAVEAYPQKKLKILYENILKTVSAMPSSAVYRKYTETLASQRLKDIKETPDLVQLEEKWGAGQLEEVIEQAKSELTLARKMNKWKPWEPLVTAPPPGQWDWP